MHVTLLLSIFEKIFRTIYVRMLWIDCDFPSTPAVCLTYFRLFFFTHNTSFWAPNCFDGRSRWPRGLRRRSATTLLLRLWFRIPPEAWMFVCCELSGRGLCDELITRPEVSFRLLCVVVCDLETSRIWRPWPALDRNATEKKNCFDAWNYVRYIAEAADGPKQGNKRPWSMVTWIQGFALALTYFLLSTST